MPTPAAARHWVQRWDRQQESYVPAREERFAVVCDVVALSVGRPNPLVVDLGCGPGSLAVRVLDRLPAADVVAVDADPVLLGLGRAAYAGTPGLRFVAADLREPGWPDALALPRPADAVVSATALHWLTGAELSGVYAACSALLAPGGVLVDADHLAGGAGTPRLRSLCEAVAVAAAGRLTPDRPEDGQRWWAAVASAPELADLTAGREAGPVAHSVPDLPSLDDHVRLLRAAGFAEVGTVWQQGDDRVLVALR